MTDIKLLSTRQMAERYGITTQTVRKTLERMRRDNPKRNDIHTETGLWMMEEPAILDRPKMGRPRGIPYKRMEKYLLTDNHGNIFSWYKMNKGHYLQCADNDLEVVACVRPSKNEFSWECCDVKTEGRAPSVEEAKKQVETALKLEKVKQ